MAIRLSALGLPLNYPSPGVSVTLTSPGAAAEGGSVTASAGVSTSVTNPGADAEGGSVTAVTGTLKGLLGPRKIGPQILPYTRASSPNASVSISSPGSSANAGQTVASAGSLFVPFAQIGPRILPSRIRTIGAKIGNATVLLPGAAAEAQGEELEGADSTIRIDGIFASAAAGEVLATGSGGAPGEEGEIEPVHFLAISVTRPRISMAMTKRRLQIVATDSTVAASGVKIRARAPVVKIGAKTRTILIDAQASGVVII